MQLVQNEIIISLCVDGRHIFLLSKWAKQFLTFAEKKHTIIYHYVSIHYREPGKIMEDGP